MKFYSDESNIAHFFTEDIKQYLLSGNLKSIFMIVNNTTSVRAEHRQKALFISVADENGNNKKNEVIISTNKKEHEYLNEVRDTIANLLESADTLDTKIA